MTDTSERAEATERHGSDRAESDRRVEGGASERAESDRAGTERRADGRTSESDRAGTERRAGGGTSDRAGSDRRAGGGTSDHAGSERRTNGGSDRRADRTIADPTGDGATFDRRANNATSDRSGDNATFDRRPDDDGRVLRARTVRQADETAAPPPKATPGGANDPDVRLRVRDTLIEKIIRGAQERGAFDDLPYQGERLPHANDELAGDMASAFRILRNAGAAPPWVEADKLVRRLLDERDRLLERASRAGPLSRQRYRDQLRGLVREHNRAVFALNHQAPSDRQHRRPLDLATELAALEARWQP